MINSHSTSESARLIQDLKQQILKDQNAIRLEDPKLKRLEQEIAREKQDLVRKEAEATHSREHIQELKDGLAQSEREFRELQTEIQKMGLSRH
ncbi:MAG: hypothetical protein WCV82_03480 [Candidatus Paceibacterota bacterium]